MEHYNMTYKGSRLFFDVDEFDNLLEKNIVITSEEATDIDFMLLDHQLIVDLDHETDDLTLTIDLIDSHGNFGSYSYTLSDFLAETSPSISSSKDSAIFNLPIVFLMIIVVIPVRKRRSLPS
jgi:hypothetical protein